MNEKSIFLIFGIFIFSVMVDYELRFTSELGTKTTVSLFENLTQKR